MSKHEIGERQTMKKKLLMLDLDGTIADTIWSIREAVNLTLAKHGYPEKSYEEIRVAIGNGARNLIRRSLPTEVAANEENVTRVLSEYDVLYGETYDHVNGCYEGMCEALHTLYDKGYKIAVLSNKQDAYVKKIVEILFPDGIIAYVQGQTELPIKPDPTVSLMIARTLGISPEDAAFIGDSDVDIITGKNAGMLAVGCAWGYRGRAVLEQADADYVLEHPSELLTLFD